MREVDPRGVEQRKHGRLHRRMYVSPGANFCWQIDGYDKLKPLGISIRGCVDGFSRRITYMVRSSTFKQEPTVNCTIFLEKC